MTGQTSQHRWQVWIYTTWKLSVFGVILVHIFPHSDWIRRDTEYLSVLSPNAGNTDQNYSEYGHFLRSDNDFQILSQYVKFRIKLMFLLIPRRPQRSVYFENDFHIPSIQTDSFIYFNIKIQKSLFWRFFHSIVTLPVSLLKSCLKKSTGFRWFWKKVWNFS